MIIGGIATQGDQLVPPSIPPSLQSAQVDVAEQVSLAVRGMMVFKISFLKLKKNNERKKRHVVNKQNSST